MIRRHTPDFALDDSGFDDKATFAMIARGETKGVFQMESVGMVDAARKLGPDRIEEIIAILALYRPGPMDFIPNFIARKKGLEMVRLHASLAGEDLERDLRHSGLSGAGDAGGQPAGGLLARPSRFVAPRDGEKGQRENGRAARHFRRRVRRDERNPDRRRATRSSTCWRSSRSTGSTSPTRRPTAW